MLTVVLILIFLICLGWFVYEVNIAWKLSTDGIRHSAVVTRRESISTGKTNNIRLWVSFETDQGRKELPLGYMSWWGFRHLKHGGLLDIVHHPQFQFVVPNGLGGVAARPIISCSLMVTSFIVAFAFYLVPIRG
jgi:hypothetical protein